MRSRLLAAVTLTLLTAQAHATDGYFSLGYGIQSKAEAGTGIALARDALTIATNPAGLTAAPGSLEIGADVFAPSRGATLTQGGVPADFSGNGTSAFLIPELGYNRSLGKRAAFGVAVFGNGGMNTDYDRNPFARFGATGSAGVDLTQLFISPGVAVKLGDSQSFGVALNGVYQRFKAKGIGLFAGFSADPAHVSDQGYDASTGFGLRVGWQGQFGQHLRLGATWQPKIRTGAFDRYRGLFADAGGFDIPETYGIGLAVRPGERWQLALDWQRTLYSDVPSVGDPLNALFAGVPLGAPNGPGFGWQDVTVWKLGGNVRLNDRLVLRAGVARNDQPIPSSQTFINILAPGVVRTHTTFGVTWALDATHELDFAYMHAARETVAGSGSIPPAFGGGEADLRLAENSLGFAWRRRFGGEGTR